MRKLLKNTDLYSTMSEILAPAGNESCAIAAINAGCDAIYLGLDRFSARSSAENFDEEKFKNICRYAHSFNVKVYAALNTVVKQEELNEFFNAVACAWNGGADALIIQDLFLGKFLKSKFPQLKLHLSTQAGTCNLLGAELAKEYGFDRVILARETKLEDISKISEIIETEAFIQGALCTCFSGQCYMSSFVGGNSGNRGKCKQPCRKKYSIDRNGFEEEAYRLSLSDLCLGENIKKLKEAGVSSFKIEGRMRRPEYVSAAVKYYKNILGGNSDSNDFSDLKRTFNRGNYTSGLAFGQDKNFISSAVQGHIGEFVGVIKVENGKYICLTKFKFGKDCGFKILREGKEAGGGVYGGEAKNGFIISTRDRLKNGDKAFITTDSELNERLLKIKRKIPLKINLSLKAGEPATAIINGYEVRGDILSVAKTRPVSEEEIIRCFEKTDSYPFNPECEIETDGVFIAASSLNAFRRKVYSEYFEKISRSDNIKIEEDFSFPLSKSGQNNKTAVISTDLRGKICDIGVLKLNDFNSDVKALTQNFDGEKYLFVPSFLIGSEVERFKELAVSFDGIYCDGYFGIRLAEKLKKPLFAGTGFNITNSVSRDNCPAKYTALSKELTIREADAISTENTFFLSSGNIKVMDLIYCPFEKKCSSCDKRENYTLTDESGRKFPLRRYETSECRFEVFNCANLIPVNCKSGKLCDDTVKNNGKSLTHGHTASGVY